MAASEAIVRMRIIGSTRNLNFVAMGAGQLAQGDTHKCDLNARDARVATHIVRERRHSTTVLVPNVRSLNTTAISNWCAASHLSRLLHAGFVVRAAGDCLLARVASASRRCHGAEFRFLPTHINSRHSHAVAFYSNALAHIAFTIGECACSRGRCRGAISGLRECTQRLRIRVVKSNSERWGEWVPTRRRQVGVHSNTTCTHG